MYFFRKPQPEMYFFRKISLKCTFFDFFSAILKIQTGKSESNSNPIDALQNDLDAFREQWKKELEASEKNKDGVEKDTEDDVHMKARELFIEAAALEEKGKRDLPGVFTPHF